MTSTTVKEPLSVKALLQALDLGSSVAEHDRALARYFVETPTFKKMIEDRGDIIAGDKGTGKTALYRILQERYTHYPELTEIEVVAAFNPTGTPIFQRILETDPLGEQLYIGVWKAYFLSLGGNWLLSLYDKAEWTTSMEQLDKLLSGVGLRSADDSAETVFSQLMNMLRRIFSSKKVKAVEGSVGFTDVGMILPVMAGRIEIADDSGDPGTSLVRHDDALRLLNKALNESDLKVWLAMDRLDEAFQSQPRHETPALRALLRTYLDMQNLDRVRCKIFVRNDLFGRITEGGFVNLTHINARRIDIRWDSDDLYNLLYRRIIESEDFIASLGLDAHSLDADSLFAVVFPKQVDQGSRKPITWNWMMTRIQDGNSVRPPRNLIDLVLKAQEFQIRADERNARTLPPAESLITGDSLKRGLDALSSQRVEDTLLAEAGDYAPLIDKFRDGKAEHNTQTIDELLGPDSGAKVKILEDIGFLERTGSAYKVPMLYRSGLGITQGRASRSLTGSDEDELEEDDM